MTTANALGIVVADMDAAMAFYARLGLTFGDVADGHTDADLVPGFKLMLDTEESIQPFTPSWARPSGSPRASLAFQLDTPADVDAKYRELVDAGSRSERAPWDAFWGQRFASVLDPDGNGVDLYAVLKS